MEKRCSPKRQEQTRDGRSLEDSTPDFKTWRTASSAVAPDERQRAEQNPCTLGTLMKQACQPTPSRSWLGNRFLSRARELAACQIASLLRDDALVLVLDDHGL